MFGTTGQQEKLANTKLTVCPFQLQYHNHTLIKQLPSTVLFLIYIRLHFQQVGYCEKQCITGQIYSETKIELQFTVLSLFSTIQKVRKFSQNCFR